MSSQNADLAGTGDKHVDDFNVSLNDKGDDNERSPRSGDQRPRGRGRGRGGGRGRGFGGGYREGRGRGGRSGYRGERNRNSESHDKDRNQNDSRSNGEQLANGTDANGAVNGEKPRYNQRRYRGRDNRSGSGWGRRRTPRNSESNADGSRAEAGAREGAKGRPPRRPRFTRFTHFLSIPFNTKPIQDKFAEFRAEVLEKYGADEATFIGEDLFQNPARIHLTFGIMQLDNEEQEKAAIALLEKSIEDIVRPTLAGAPLNIKISGVGNLVNKRTGKSRVVFAKVTEGAEKLQEIANKITKRFVDEKIVLYEIDEEKSEVSVLLHITLMNTTFRERIHRRKPNHFKLPRPKQFFDAQKLLEDYSEYVFADQLNIDSLHISNARRFTTDGFYEPLAVVPFAEGAATVVTPRPPPKEKPQKEQATPEKSEKSGSTNSSNNTSPQAAATTPVSN